MLRPRVHTMATQTRTSFSIDAKQDFEAVAKKTEAERQPLKEAVTTAMRPVTHSIELRAVDSVQR